MSFQAGRVTDAEILDLVARLRKDGLPWDEASVSEYRRRLQQDPWTPPGFYAEPLEEGNDETQSVPVDDPPG